MVLGQTIVQYKLFIYFYHPSGAIRAPRWHGSESHGLPFADIFIFEILEISKNLCPFSAWATTILQEILMERIWFPWLRRNQMFTYFRRNSASLKSSPMMCLVSQSSKNFITGRVSAVVPFSNWSTKSATWATRSAWILLWEGAAG